MQDEKQNGRQDLSALSCAELKERLTRQERMLSNRQFLARLPDKGQKILVHIQRLHEALATQELVESAARELSAMSLAGDGSDVKHASSTRPGLSTLSEMEDGENLDKSSTSVESSEALDSRNALASPSNSLTSLEKKKPGRDLDAVRQRVKQSEPKKAVLLSAAESAKILMTQEERLQELQMSHAAQILQNQSGSHVVGTVTADASCGFGDYRSHGGRAEPNRLSDSELSDEECDLD